MFRPFKPSSSGCNFYNDINITDVNGRVRFGFSICTCKYHPGSSVGIATDYGLDGPALGPTQPPVKWVPALSRG